MNAEIILYVLSAVFLVITIAALLFTIKRSKINKKYRQIIDSDTTTLTMLTQTQEEKTELLTDEEATALLENTYFDEASVSRMDAEPSPIEEKYRILYEIKGGGMSRIFVAENRKLGNKWIIKYIDKKVGTLSQEENVLRLLNHTNLPSIVDVFYNNDGVYIVESLIEGLGLDKVRAENPNIGQTTIIEWANELGGLLNYLHNDLEQPIVHADLKPSNIMVTHGEKLVLIDFGISKLGEQEIGNFAATYKYAAPEQIINSKSGKVRQVIADRFGELPEGAENWKVDCRTDIYSMGVILYELITGHIPTAELNDDIHDYVSKDLANVIQKCISINPADRYQNVAEFLTEIQKLQMAKVSMFRSMMWQKISVAVMLICMVSTGTCFGSARYITAQENLALVDMAPDSVCVSEQQRAELIIQKQMPNGTIKSIKASDVEWDINDDNIAFIDGDMVVGVNEGKTTVYGKYRNKVIALNVAVVKPIQGKVEVSLCYGDACDVSTYAGSAERDFTDGTLGEAAFVSPERMTTDESSRVYICDSGRLRVMDGDTVSTIDIEPSYLSVCDVKCYKDEVFALTDAWTDEDGTYYGIIKISGGEAEGWYIADGIYTRATDFDFDDEGNLYIIEYNYGEDFVYLKKVDRESGDVTVVGVLEDGAEAISYGNGSLFYYSNIETGTVKTYDVESGESKFFVGTEGKRDIIDGKAPLFYEPIRIKAVGNYLYVMDFDVLRRVIISDGVPIWAETVAGVVTTDDFVPLTEGKMDEVSFSRSKRVDFVITDIGTLISDPKNSVIRSVISAR